MTATIARKLCYSNAKIIYGEARKSTSYNWKNSLRSHFQPSNKMIPPPNTPKQHALNSVVTTPFRVKAFHAFLHLHLNHIYDDKGKKQNLQSLSKGTQQKRWLRTLSNEFGCLAQGNDHGVTATDTITFIPKSAVPNDKKLTYAHFICDYFPLKDKQWRSFCVVGGYKLPYNEDPASPRASLLNTKKW